MFPLHVVHGKHWSSMHNDAPHVVSEVHAMDERQVPAVNSHTVPVGQLASDLQPVGLTHALLLHV